MVLKKVQCFRLPVRGRFEQTLKTGFLFKSALKIRPTMKIREPKNRTIIPHVDICN